MSRKSKVRVMGQFMHYSNGQSLEKMQKTVLNTKTVTVPGGSGSHWKCVKCGTELHVGIQCVKVGKKMYCAECIQKGGNFETRV